MTRSRRGGRERARQAGAARKTGARRLGATLAGFLFSALLVTVAGPIHSADPALPFTEDFVDTNLRDPDRTTADWNTGDAKLYLQTTGASAVSLSGPFEVDLNPIELGSSTTRAIAVGDLTGNGHLDIVEGNQGPNRVWVNDGAGNFTEGFVTAESDNTRDVAIGDVNRDGSLDFVVVNFNGRVRVYLNDGTGQSFEMQDVTNVNRRGDAVALMDVNGNGWLDVVIGTGQEIGETGTVQPNSVVLNRRDPVHPFGPAGAPRIDLDNSVTERTRGIAIGDVDNDGDLDIVFVNSGEPTRIHINTPGECGAQAQICFVHHQIEATDLSDTRAAALGDLTGNGLLDLVVVNFGVGHEEAQDSKIYFNQGGVDQNPFTDPGVVFMPAELGTFPMDVKLADIDRDGRLDIVVVLGGHSARNRVYFNHPDDPFGEFVEIGPDPGNPPDQVVTRAVAVGDLNGDGKLDLVYGNEDTQPEQNLSALPRENWIFFNAGTADGDEDLQLRGHATSIRVDDGSAGIIESVRLEADTIEVGPEFHNQVEFWVSSDGGNYWAPISPDGRAINIASPGEDLRWRAFLTSLSPSTAGGLAVDVLTLSANNVPEAVDDAYEVNQGDVLTVAAPGVLANDTDGDDDELTAVLAQAPANGMLTLNADGSFTYTPNADFFGEETFTYRASDGALSEPATVTITVNGVPVANNDSYSVETDGELDVAAPGVLGNDVDPDGDVLTAAVVDDVQNGTLTLNADGSFTYEPDAGFSGTDTFTYQASDADAVSNIATVTITVDVSNTPPVAANDDYEVDANVVLEVDAPGVLGNDTDADGDDLTAKVVAQPSNGSLTLNEDGSFTYTPNAGFDGEDTFTYQATDGADDSNVATVTITVNAAPNDPPVANDDSYNVAPGETLEVDAPGVLGNDEDPTGQALTAVLAEDVSDGTLVLNADGSFTYTPDDGFTGTDSFTYRASDGELESEPATVMITVGETSVEPPVITLNGAATITIQVGATFTDPGATATSELDGDLTDQIEVDNPVNTAVAGTYTITYTVQDSAGNTTQAQRTVIVQAAAPPPPPPPSGGRSGGGAFGLELLGLLLLGAGALRRRRFF